MNINKFNDILKNSSSIYCCMYHFLKYVDMHKSLKKIEELEISMGQREGGS